MTHEKILIERGARSGATIIVAVHSTARGPAIGGCRVAAYPDWREGLEDALRLSAAMTGKAALAGLPHGGGKTVVVAGRASRELLHDVGDVIEGLGGAYATGPDVGTGPGDMVTIGERTGHVFCRPAGAGGSGDSSVHTAEGTLAALRAICGDDLGSRTFAVLGVGRVGSHILRLLAEEGATLIASDVDDRRKAHASGARWTDPDSCLTAEADVLVPAALGGLLTPESVPRLRCAAVAGPANNQLDAPDTALMLHERGILWAPDIVVGAGGIIHATAVELGHETPEAAAARVRGIGATLTGILAAARTRGTSPAEAARQRIQESLPHPT
ncbi:Glu/Leu/Phe/Val dehydrogenase dimerization domain-containing protein [Actinoplanes sp. RD1]|uniref:Glu/Leu/Phe/Val dehydrogenase dimerization domain-containing protein n=1 Tax=Actinoplanes sp. RD1 TaxID=3064538 RepID=UPI00274285DB|nr:Glu/Leu/Phe/Val dehydrogenase dimerization domain-containing protein [Actinoplanes sp. RD1]